MDVSGDINRIVGTAETAANAALAEDDYAEAKRALTDGIRDLRDLKRQVTEGERNLRASFQEARLKNRQSGQVVGMFVSSKTRGAMSRGRQMENRHLMAKQQSAVRPYEVAKVNIDRAISAMDHAKAQVTADAAHAKDAGTVAKAAPKVTPAASPQPAAAVAPVAPSAPVASAPPPPPPPPAAWNADPMGRHQYRWWNGTIWTENVADNGVASIDPLN